MANRIATGLLAGVLSWCAAAAQAASVASVSPQGSAGPTRQVRVVFSEPMIPFGDTRRAAPASVRCSDAPAGAGQGRWLDERSWVWNFAERLPAGVRCTVALAPDVRTLAGTSIDGPARYEFDTGGPAVRDVEPARGQTIEEGQHFRLRLDGRVDFDSIAGAAWCQAAGIGERIPLVVVEREAAAPAGRAGAQAAEPAPAGRQPIVRCQRPLPPGATMQLVWGRGVRSADGVPMGKDQRLEFEVREPFTVEMVCERENARSPCSPLGAVTLRFSAPVRVEQARGITLEVGGRRIAPEPEGQAGSIDSVTFAAPFPEQAELTASLPAGFRDDSGRAPSNAALFPMRLRFAQAPPLLKFAAAPFGIVELAPDAAVPVTVRRIEAQPRIAAASIAAAGGESAPAASPATSSGNVAAARTTDDAQAMRWLSLLQRHHERQVEVGVDRRGKPILRASRELSVLPRLGLPAERLRRLALPGPAAGDARPFEVLGIPLPEPGLHLLEAQSRRLGTALLGREAPMYVRTAALVTNLAVHLKTGASSSAVWVTTLDGGRPVAQADVRISACTGEEVWRGRTDRDGVARVPVALARPGDAPCPEGLGEWFASARKTDAGGRADWAFAMSSWTGGIEPWRFQVPTAGQAVGTVAHTVFDRTLLRAGQTVSMKHFVRTETARGLARVEADRLPDRVRIRHAGSDRSYELPLAWPADARFAETRFELPKDAPLGRWEVQLVRGRDAGAESLDAGSFRVEAFRLPVLAGTLSAPRAPLIAPAEVPLDLRIGWLAGGPANDLPVAVSAGLRRATPRFAGLEAFSFQARGSRGEDDDEAALKMIADRIDLRLDADGTGRAVVRLPPPGPQAQSASPTSPAPSKAPPQPVELVAEAAFADPNGEVQTLSTVVPVWPAAIAVGIRTDGWVSQRGRTRVEAVAVDAQGAVRAGVPIAIRAASSRWVSSRQRLVGGLYAYDSHEQVTELGVVCEGATDRQGRFACEAPLSRSGEVVLTATGTDAQRRVAAADTSVWVTRDGEIWFDADGADRMDLLPEKREYAPGETARLQVRMPFRQATALLAVEREGVLDTRVVELSGRDPTISVPIAAEHAPNVYVSVLAVRGRLREVPWYSLFVWGWKDPRQWWREFRNTDDFRAPTALVDLGKPAFKLGVAHIAVGRSAHTLRVSVATDQPQYETRSTARARVTVKAPDGRAAPAGTEVAIAAVDEALLKLAPNDSWNLVEGLLRERPYRVETATAQMQVIGRRHFGRKAVAAGGGGGKSATRELFDTLLLWRASVRLDAEGTAAVDIPLNDSLTAFRIVAVADAGDAWFGTGHATIRATRDLQLVAGLPPVVREGDAFTATATLRNATARAMQVQWSAVAEGLPAGGGRVALAAGAARTVEWPVRVPAAATTLGWRIEAREAGGAAVDRVAFEQRVVPVVPISVQQATVVALDAEAPPAGAASMPVAPPADALPGRGGIAVRLQPRLAAGLDGVQRWLEAYPYTCFEQQASRALGRRDLELWRTLLQALPGYLDTNGLVAYYPVRADLPDAGSDVLTAYLLAASDELSRLDARFALDAALRERLENGLVRFVEGRIQPRHWSPRRDLDARRLAAIEALSRHGRARASMLDAVELAPERWPTSAVIDYAATLARMPQLPRRDERLAHAEQVLRARLVGQGTRLAFSTERDDFWWWLMVSGDLNAARLLAWAVERPDWKADVPRLVTGLLGRQRHGAWLTTNANAWGTIAVEKFSRVFEREPVSGVTAVALRVPPGIGQPSSGQELVGADATDTVRAQDWSRQPDGARLQLPWPTPGRGGATAPSGLGLAHRGGGQPWATVEALAAVPAREPIAAGYRIDKTVDPVRVRTPGRLSRGDVLRVRLVIDAQADASWVVVDDPVPAGATILGSGLGRDSRLDARALPAESGDRLESPPEYEERRFEGWRGYYRFVPAGRFTVAYTVRLNSAGEFQLPPTRVEAMYAPETFGLRPNATLQVAP